MRRWLGMAGIACLAMETAVAVDPARLDALMATAPAGGLAGIHVVAASTGKTLYARNEDRLLLPASNQKILTSALALERLGRDYRFTTHVIREASGDVALVGSGDPSLSGRVFPYDKDARRLPSLTAIEDLAEQIVTHGIRRIDGDIVGDDRLYPWDPYPPSWTQDDAIRDYGAPVSALTLNDNLIMLSIAPGARAGDPARLSLEPALEYLTIENRVATGARASEPRLHAEHVPGSRQWRIGGSVPLGHMAVLEEIPVDDPALFAAGALYDALARRGITVRGQPVARHRAFGDAYTPVQGEELAVRTSPPLSELLQVMDKVSQNLHAELMIRELGRVASGDGTTEAGIGALRAYLAGISGWTGDWQLEDGSGLSRNALVTPRLLTLILAHMAQSTERNLWLSLLPAGGEDGTLSRRLCCMTAGRGIRAKTGTLSRALALSGYADSATQGQLAFSILVNDFSAPPGEVRQWIDKIASALLE